MQFATALKAAVPARKTTCVTLTVNHATKPLRNNHSYQVMENISSCILETLSLWNWFLGKNCSVYLHFSLQSKANFNYIQAQLLNVTGSLQETSFVDSQEGKFGYMQEQSKFKSQRKPWFEPYLVWTVGKRVLQGLRIKRLRQSSACILLRWAFKKIMWETKRKVGYTKLKYGKTGWKKHFSTSFVLVGFDLLFWNCFEMHFHMCAQCYENALCFGSVEDVR